ncbi:transcription factor kayak-like isoform X2 [Limulus polyphemus]|uniref:Transcription factor kayak-like isoform X2 n=1 Tax=Limulus polyphemus TaxID=6850 RepID=A0ABM1BT29_LIMPO|nr:transcription factor kayak-like isoform X2 [Limulus polyphemus]
MNTEESASESLHSSTQFSGGNSILSVGSGTEICTTSAFANVSGLTSGIPTRTTPTVTPTTLKNIETLFELQSIPPAPLEHQHQAGFVPPVVNVPTLYQPVSLIKQEEEPEWMASAHSQSTSNSLFSEDSLTMSPPPVVTTTSSSKARSSGGRRPRNEKVSPEEEERRRVRRERNKLAAARCRKRRLDHTNSLIKETEGLEKKRQALQNEIQLLTSQKEELDFLLAAHKATCKLLTSHKSVENGKESSNNMILRNGPNSSSGEGILNKSKRVSRPTSLPVSSTYMSSSDLPTTGVFNMDSLMEGGTGLTPVSSSVSCSGQQKKSGIIYSIRLKMSSWRFLSAEYLK